ncbi:MAG: DUF4401 domain-containing protein [Usitatibacter sp.]
MITTTPELIDALELRGLARATGEEKDIVTAAERPWYIGLLLGTAGWFAGIFVLILAAILFSPKSGGAALVMGLLLIAAAWGIFRGDRDGAFLSQLGLAFSIAGQFAVLFGANEMFFQGARLTGFAITALVMQVALVFAMPNGLHRTMSTLFACIAWAMSVRYGVWDHYSFGPMAGREPQGVALFPALLGWLVVWVPVGYGLFLLVRREPRWMLRRRQELLRPVGAGLIVGLAFATLLSQPLDSFTSSFIERGIRNNWLALWPLLSALASLGALVAAFALGSRGLMALCVVAALLHASHFYYAMGTTLLVKALTMLLLGAALLGAADYLRNRSGR